MEDADWIEGRGGRNEAVEEGGCRLPEEGEGNHPPSPATPRKQSEWQPSDQRRVGHERNDQTQLHGGGASLSDVEAEEGLGEG
ncbi:hypothetical protein AC480_04020 [miscellaneous Crenarchaeota group archaeon SMTZ1-55]|nr:MAG: hypothetical protein AC480_04020 [miscellaneous Crenarchaeota group archaeon SMTZ1-55]